MGSNTTAAHPIIANRIRKSVKNGVKLIVIDPREIDMVQMAHSHLKLNVGTDIALMNAMLHVIIHEQLYDDTFINRNTTGLKQLKKHVEAYSPQVASTITGLTVQQIESTARLYAQAKNAMIAYTLGITEHKHGVNNVLDIANLALVTGHIGREGNGIMPLRGQNNVQGAGDMGCLPNQLPGAVPLADTKALSRFEQTWGVTLNPTIGLNQTSMIQAMHENKIRALYIVGENPIKAEANSEHTKAALNKLDLLIVQDIFMTETAQIADVVLPARAWAEVEGTYTNTERRIQRVRQAVAAEPNVKNDWDIFCELSTLLGYPMQYSSAEHIWDEIRNVAPHMYGGMPYTRLDEEGGLHYPCPSEEHPGTFILHTRFHEVDNSIEIDEFDESNNSNVSNASKRLYDSDLSFDSITRNNEDDCRTHEKAPFTCVDYEAPAEPTDDEFPFTLTTGRRYETYNTNTQTQYYDPKVKLKQHYETLDIHPYDALSLGIGDNEWVTVRSRRGEVSVRVKITHQMSPGLVFMSFHWSDAMTNRLTVDALDSKSGTAEFKSCAVSITPKYVSKRA